ncbi:MAG: glycosyltransferase [Granulosicoccus sp.]|nr:glycosyltransferase [Granulosicoccus sp.]
MSESQGNRDTILHIAPTPFFSDRGCHIRIAGIVTCLQKLNFNNLVCTYHLGKDVNGIATCRIANIKNYQKTTAGPSKYKLWADFKLLCIALKQYRHTRPVAIHAHLHEGVLVAWFVKLLNFWRRTPVVADLQGSLVGELETYGSFKKYPFLKWPIALIERVLLLLPNHIVCSSQHALEIMTARFPESAHKLTLAQDGADEPEAVDQSELAQLRSQLDIDPEAICVVYSGVLMESKGLNELKQIIHLCKGQTKPIHFLIVGYPTEELTEFLHSNNLESICSLTGQIPFDTLPSYLALGDIALDTKNSEAGEGSGKILNYMANAKPIIAFNTTNNRKFLGTDTTLANNVNEAHQIMMSFADDQSTRRNTGKQHYERFKHKYSWDVSVTQLEAVYRRFLPVHFDKE